MTPTGLPSRVHRALAWLVSLAVGALLGTVSYLLGSSNPWVTASVVAAYAVTVRLAFLHPDVVYEEGVAVWEVGRWSAVSSAFVLVLALAVMWAFPVDSGLGFSLALLTVGVGYAMWVFGVAYARAKAPR
jgi:uncharacterized membrane protein YgaE (UPF0421/DUF939 family)